MIQHGTAPFLECSSKGDRRFSAFGAHLRCCDNRSIIELHKAGHNHAWLWDWYMWENPLLLLKLKAATGLSDVYNRTYIDELWRIRCA